MFSTPLICSSIGVTTVWATTSELAPGYWPVTLIVGGAISGYCAIGRRENDTPPTITNTIDTTAAKIGRSMKKCEMRIVRAPGALFGLGHGRARRRRFLGRHLGSGPHHGQPVDDDPVLGREPVLDDAQSVLDLPERDVFLPGDILRVDRVDELARLLGPDRHVGNQQRLVGQRARDLDAAEHAGREQGGMIF